VAQVQAQVTGLRLWLPYHTIPYHTILYTIPHTIPYPCSDRSPHQRQVLLNLMKQTLFNIHPFSRDLNERALVSLSEMENLFPDPFVVGETTLHLVCFNWWRPQCRWGLYIQMYLCVMLATNTREGDLTHTRKPAPYANIVMCGTSGKGCYLDQMGHSLLERDSLKIRKCLNRQSCQKESNESH